MKKITYVILIMALLLNGCGANSSNISTVNANSSSNAADTDTAKDVSDMFTDRDYEIGYDENTSVLIQLNGDSISCNSDSVKISGTTATIADEGTYILSGTLNDGMIVVNAGKKDKPQLVLNGVNINSKTSAPVYILEADKVFITLAADTSNTLSNGGSFTAVDENNIDSVIFSKQDLTLNGSGNLMVTSPAGHGIVSKDDLVFTSGTYTINSASHGLDANDSVRIANAEITIDAGKDGIHAENSDDTELGFVYIASGAFDIFAEDDGINAGAYMLISDGTFKIDSADDAVHSNASIVVNGGNFEIASGDDGFHADEALTITAGTINIKESYEGLEALNLEISGGDITLVATDDGLNAAGGRGSSGFGGPRGNDNFGGHRGGDFGGARGNGIPDVNGENNDFGDRRGNKGFGGPQGNVNFDGSSGENDGFTPLEGNEGFGGGRGGRGTFSDASIVISGGNLYIKASGDGIDANGTLEISGGNITVCGPINGDTATLDYDVSGVITGGTFIGTGASGMAQSFSSSEQGVIAMKVGNQSAGTQVTLTDTSGNELVSYTPELPFAVVILSSPEIVTGETYTLSVGTVSEEVSAG
ncbi:MAG: carbohydrate-binding domain-containing protein [Lachnospiraceae bacterium]|nr:carbohydrate-binding domain-containing protein [Lachnospiraceae bacterium]